VYAGFQSRSPTRHTRFTGAEDPRLQAADAWFRNLYAHSAGLRRTAAIEPGNTDQPGAESKLAMREPFREFIQRLAALFRRSHLEDDLDAELRSRTWKWQ
jgi:hypothetical protein